MRRRWQVALGFVILGGLVGIGIVPARKRMTVRVNEPARRKQRRTPTRQRKVGVLRRLLRR